MTPNAERTILGLPEMDEQHRYLYELFDNLGRVSPQENRPAAAALLKEVEHYFLFHCGSEEQLMRYYDFPGFSTHQTDHENAGAKLVQFLDDFDAGTLNPAAMRIFLTGWLMEHSRLSDTVYAAWVKEKRQALGDLLTSV